MDDTTTPPEPNNPSLPAPDLIEVTRPGMDPMAERILVSVGSISESSLMLVAMLRELRVDHNSRRIRSPVLRPLDVLADNEEEEKGKG
jgi:hypothetical protein